MVDYEFYRSEFGGTDLDPREFEGYAARAARLLAGYKRRFRLSPAAENAEENALCQLAETLQYFDWLENGGGAAGVSVGSVARSGSFAKPLGAREKSAELYRAAGLYFDIYRGMAGGKTLCEE